MASCKAAVMLVLMFAVSASAKHWWRKKVVSRSASDGQVDALYTFGAASVAGRPLTNSLSKDGCFAGKRVYSLNMTGTLDWAATLLPILRDRTPVQDVVELTVDMTGQLGGLVPQGWTQDQADLIRYYGHEKHKPCSRAIARTPRGKAASRLTRLGADLHSRSYWFNYSDPLLMQMFAIATAPRHPHGSTSLCPFGIQEVSKVIISDPFNKISGKNDKDAVHLFQDKNSLKCFITFRSADQESVLDIVQHVFSKTWCGIKGLGKYVVDELDDLVKSPEWKSKIQDKLPKCRGVDLVGHSLGGSIVGILAACLNRKSWDKKTYDRLLWKTEEPELLVPDSNAQDRCQTGGVRLI